MVTWIEDISLNLEPSSILAFKILKGILSISARAVIERIAKRKRRLECRDIMSDLFVWGNNIPKPRKFNFYKLIFFCDLNNFLLINFKEIRFYIMTSFFIKLIKFWKGVILIQTLNSTMASIFFFRIFISLICQEGQIVHEGFRWND